MCHKILAKRLLIALAAGIFSCSFLPTVLANPGHGFPPPGSSRPNPGSTSRDFGAGFHHPNPGSTIRNPALGSHRPNPGSAFNRPANRPQGPNIPVPSVTVHNPPAPGQTSYSNHPSGRPGRPYYNHDVYYHGPYNNYPHVNPYWSHGPQRPPYISPRPYHYWPRSGIVFRFGWPRPYYWWGCRRGIPFGDYLLLALMIETMRGSRPYNIDDMYSEHLNGLSYADMCQRYDLDWSDIETRARLRYDQMSVYAQGQGIAFWGWNDRLVY